MTVRTVLFVCVENAARSLMAEAVFNADPPDGWRAESAGTRPASSPNPRTSRMLAEIGLKIPSHPPRELTNAMMTEAAVRITMGCLDSASCPARLKALPLTDSGPSPTPDRSTTPGSAAFGTRLRERVERLRRELSTDPL
ncbi:Protein-tyrosine phosphatase, low molecular weight, partial [mine drainage metagenome]